jgi:hypothetical protein
MTPAQTATPTDVRERHAGVAAEPEQLSGAAGAEPERRTYRGRELAELLPRIRAELGPDAVVTCQREGLVGGIRGFFAQRFVEVEAMSAPPPPLLDIYDGEDAEPPTAEFEAVTLTGADNFEETLVPGEGFFETLDGVVAISSGDDFASALAAASTTSPAPEAAGARAGGRASAQPDSPLVFAAPPAAPAPIDAPTLDRGAVGQPVAASPRAQARPVELPWSSAVQAADPMLLHSPSSAQAEIESAWLAGESREAGEFLIARGISARLAEDLIGDARTHDLPFAGAGGMRDALCGALARRLPRHRGLPRGGALVAVVGAGGSGKTRCAAAIAASYQGASALDVRTVVLGRYDSGAELSSLVEPLGISVQTAERGSRAAVDVASARTGMLVVADTPTVSPADPAGIGMLAVELAALAPEEVLVTLPATSNAAAARQLLAAIAPLSPSGLIVTHADETDQLGTAVELSLESGLPLVYIHSGLELSGALAPADPTATAERLLT